MSKGKLAKFADMERYENVFQYPFSVVEQVPFEMKGHWRDMYFHNDNPIVLELGCGKGEYAVGLARLFPDINFIGVDIKGARMWTGATEALAEGLKNVAFLRTNIEIIDRFFSAGEVQEIWLTFSDPQMKNVRKRLTSTYFMERYRRFLVDGGIVHVKTDSNFLFTYTTYMVEHNHLPLLYQAGYLTIKDRDTEFDSYLLDLPNREVRLGLMNSLVPSYVTPDTRPSNKVLREMARCLSRNDMDGALRLLQTFLSTVPYTDHTDYEGHYQQVLYIIFSLMGYYVDVEVHTPKGRVDVVMRTAHTLYIIEVKLDKNAEAAMKQIDLKNYPERFALCGLPIVKVGVNFDSERHTIEGWEIRPL